MFGLGVGETSKIAKVTEDDTGNGPGDWVHSDPGRVGSKVPPFIKPPMKEEDKIKLESCKSAYDFYKLFSPDTYVNNVIYQTKLYCVQSNLNRLLDRISPEAYRCTEAFLLYSGYNRVPKKKMVWETRPDCRNEFIASHVRRDRVDSVLQGLHFSDNTKMNNDSLYEVRPIFKNLNQEGIKWFNREDKYSIGEVMIPYYGRQSSSKQSMLSEPSRYGFKVWSLCTHDGCGVHFEPCFGSQTVVEDQGLGQGPSVVLDLVTKASIPEGSEVFFDNQFTTCSLLERLSKMKLGGTGTVSLNR